jgi:hypothetical protein
MFVIHKMRIVIDQLHIEYLHLLYEYYNRL